MIKVNNINMFTGRFGMNKGKPRKSEKRRLSILVVPHSSSHVRVFNFTSLYGKLFIAFILFAVLAAGTTLYLIRVTSENRGLKENLTELYSANSEQRKLLEEKTQEIAQIKQNEEDFNSKVNREINDFARKFNEITDKYINGQDGTKTDRSGDRDEKSFSGDIMELKSILDSLAVLYKRTDLPLSTLSDTEEKIRKFLDTIPTLWPAEGRLSSVFGYRRDPITRGREYHEGLDIAVPYGTSIQAAASGKVILAAQKGGYGRTVIIDHGHGLSTLYGHASKLLVKEGQIVKKGDVIAKAGSSGRSTRPHVHFEVLLYNTPVDPLKYLDEK